MLHPLLNHRQNLLITFIFSGIAFLLIYIIIVGAFGKLFPLVLGIHRPLVIYRLVYMAIRPYFYKNWLAIVKVSQRIPMSVKILLLFSISLIMISESSSVQSFTGKEIAPYEYVMFSCIMSVVALFLCFASIERSYLSQPLKKRLNYYQPIGWVFCINGIDNIALISIIAPIVKQGNLKLT